MKYPFILIFSVICLGFGVVPPCGPSSAKYIDHKGTQQYDSMNNKLRITIGSTVFTATLYENETVKTWKGMLPLTLKMIELNGNEKYYHFPNDLPANDSDPRVIQTGDLMLYASNSFVLFYKTFNTTYLYTRIGRIDNTSGLSAALGSGNVTVKFELK